MKSVKRIVDTGFWSDEKVMNFSPEDKYFWLFLLTNEYTTQLGIYHLPLKKAAIDLGYSVESIKILLDRFENEYDLIKYSAETSEVAIKNYLLYSIVKGGKPVLDCLIKEQKQVKDKKLLGFICKHLENREINNNTVLDYINQLNISNEFNYINDNDNDNERIVDESSTNRGFIFTGDKIDYQIIVDIYHNACPSLPKVSKITDARKKLINARLKDYTEEELEKAFKLAEESDFLTGRNGKWGGANFDWIMNTNNIVKILEGNYKNKSENKPSGFTSGEMLKSASYDWDEINRELGIK